MRQDIGAQVEQCRNRKCLVLGGTMVKEKRGRGLDEDFKQKGRQPYTASPRLGSRQHWTLGSPWIRLNHPIRC